MEFDELLATWGLKPGQPREVHFVKCGQCRRSFTAATVLEKHVCHRSEAAQKHWKLEEWYVVLDANSSSR